MKRRLTAAAAPPHLPRLAWLPAGSSPADACKEIATARTSVHHWPEHWILTCSSAKRSRSSEEAADMYRDAGKKVSNKEVKAANDVLKDLDKSVEFSGRHFTTSPEYEQNEEHRQPRTGCEESPRVHLDCGAKLLTRTLGQEGQPGVGCPSPRQSLATTSRNLQA